MKKNKILNFGLILCALNFLLVVSAAAQSESENIQTEGSNDALPLAAAGQFITLDFNEADIHNVLKIISYKSGVNVVSGPEVIGKVTMRLVDVPWERALDVILKTYGFGYEWLSSKILMVSTLEKLSQQRKAQQEAQEMEPLDTQTFVLNFSNAEDMKITIEKLLSPKGKAAVETHANALIITDTKSNLMRIGEVISGLDKITPQVMIEARIIETTLGSAEKLGINWSIQAGLSGSKRPTTFPFQAEEYKGTGKTMLPVTQQPSSIERVTTTSYSSTGVPLSTTTTEQLFHSLVRGFPDVSVSAFLFGTLDFSQFQAVLEILSSRSDTKILSDPRITTLNNQEAKMVVGTVVPVPRYEYSKETGTRIISGYDDIEIGIKLIVTPNVNEQNYITLDVKPNVDEIVAWTGPNNERPVISTRSAETKVMVKNGQTIVMGGLISEKKIKSKKGFPILKNIPVLDLVFGKRDDTFDKTELLIFITPHIIKENEFLPEEIARLEAEMFGRAVKKEKAVKSKGK